MERKPFHRNDFTGSAGPGLARLRAKAPAHSESSSAKLERARYGLEYVRRCMHEERWDEAILSAAKFPNLGDEAAAIHRGREAILRPYFQRQLKRDPELMRLEAIAALKARYGNV